jgi:succinyl-diaminopimelate desuccinylase
MHTMSIDTRPYEQRAARLRDFIVDLTLEICRRRTVDYLLQDYPQGGPDDMPAPGMEGRVTEVLAAHLDAWKVPYATHVRTPGRDNLLARIGRGEPGYRKLFLLLHTDTVPAGDRDAWKFDPFDPFEKDGKLYGRGVLDNKGPLAATFAAFKLLHEDETEIPGQVVFGAVGDEEVGVGDGIEFLLSEGLIDATDAIVPDVAGEMREINVAEKGRLVVKVRAKGKQAHAMDPSKGVNAIHAAARFLHELEGFRFAYEPHVLLDPPTINTGIIRGGSAPNSVAADCEVTLDIRYLPSQNAERILADLEGVAAKVQMPGARFLIEKVQNALPCEVAPDAPIVKLIQQVAPDARPLGSGGGTFSKPLVHAGIQAVGWAPGHEATYHQANEEIEVAQLVTFAGRMAALARAIASMRI